MPTLPQPPSSPTQTNQQNGTTQRTQTGCQELQNVTPGKYICFASSFVRVHTLCFNSTILFGFAATKFVVPEISFITTFAFFKTNRISSNNDY
jgi:hypothetical protein